MEVNFSTYPPSIPKNSLKSPKKRRKVKKKTWYTQLKASEERRKDKGKFVRMISEKCEDKYYWTSASFHSRHIPARCQANLWHLVNKSRSLRQLHSLFHLAQAEKDNIIGYWAREDDHYPIIFKTTHNFQYCSHGVMRFIHISMQRNNKKISILLLMFFQICSGTRRV